jgi:hypothetical protein
MKFKKGSQAAKDHMAKIRAKRGKPKKVGAKKIARKKALKRTLPKFLVSNKKSKTKIGALPVGFTGKFYGVPFKIYNQFDIYGKVSAIIEDTNNGREIVEVTDRIKAPGQIQAFENYLSITAQYDIAEIKRAKDAKNFITNLYNEVKNYNAGKTGTTKAKKGINVKVVKRPGSNVSVKTTKEVLKNDLKLQNLRLTHGYDLVKRINGLFDTTVITDLDSLKKQYYKLAKKYHPDAGGTTIQFQELENEYSKLFKKLLAGSNLNEDQKKNEVELDENLNKALLQIISLPGIDIELIGKWIWVSGITFPIRNELSAAGFTFSGKKKMWYYAGIESAGRGKSSIEEIRAKYGTEKIKKTDFKNLSGIGTIPLSKRAKLKMYLKKAVKNLNKRPI